MQDLLSKIASETDSLKDHYTESLGGEWLGIIVNNEDPEFKGRCKIRVFEKFDKIPDEALPWAYPATSTIFAGDASAGSFSYPKKGHLVSVTFNNQDIYHPEYTIVEKLNKKLISEISQSYVNCQVLVYDQDEDLKILYTQKDGLMIWHKESFVNIDKDTHIKIHHSKGPSFIELIDGEITEYSKDKHYIDTPDARIGHNASHPDTKCDILFQLLEILATYIDAKVPTTPGVAKGIVQAMREQVCSKTVQIAD